MAQRDWAEWHRDYEVLQADAGLTDACADAVPAHIVVACGL